MSYDHLYNNLEQNAAFKANFWLINAVSAKESNLTSGSVQGFSNYASLLDFEEKSEVIAPQNHGIQNISFDNVMIKMPKGENSFIFYSHFKSGSIIQSITLLQVINSSGAIKEKYKIVFKSCRIESYSNSMEFGQFTFNYNSRNEIITQHHESGAKKGSLIG